MGEERAKTSLLYSHEQVCACNKIACLLILPRGDDWNLKRDRLERSQSNIACITEACSLCSVKEKGNFCAES